MLFIAYVLNGTSAVAADQSKNVYDLPQAVAIQPRKYDISSSLLFSVGYIPTDSFNRGITLTGAYRYALTSYLTWEIISFTYVLNKETSLKQQIESLSNSGSIVSLQGVGAGGVLDYPKQIYMTGFHYAPMYSKSLLFNSKLTYSETSLFLGFGSLMFAQGGPKPMIAPGLSTRIYFSPNAALVAYFRDYFYSDSNTGLTGIMDFGLGFEYKFGGEKN